MYYGMICDLCIVVSMAQSIIMPNIAGFAQTMSEKIPIRVLNQSQIQTFNIPHPWSQFHEQTRTQARRFIYKRGQVMTFCQTNVHFI